VTPQFLEKAETKVAPVKPNETNGTVLVIFWTSESGTVVSVRALDGPAGLQKAATEAIYKWKFKPMSVNGQPVQMGSAVSVDSSQTTAVMQAPKPMTARNSLLDFNLSASMGWSAKSRHPSKSASNSLPNNS